MKNVSGPFIFFIYYTHDSNFVKSPERKFNRQHL